MEDDFTLGGGNTMQYTDCVSQKCTHENYMALLTNVTPIPFITKKKKDKKKIEKVFLQSSVPSNEEMMEFVYYYF